MQRGRGRKSAEDVRLHCAGARISPSNVIVASTGVIGQVLPIEPIIEHAPQLAASLSESGSLDAARAIMTTDLVPKEAAVELTLGGKTVRIGGIAKGSGMICPNMATMLAFLTTDATISSQMLDAALHEAVAESFNMISVDGDTSTNDMVSIMASGLAEPPPSPRRTRITKILPGADRALRDACPQDGP